MAVSLPYPVVNGTTGDGTQMQANLTALLNGVNAAATLASPALTGTPTAPTAVAGTNTTQLATTAFVQGLLASTALTGVPTAPTAAAATNTTQLATTAFVFAERTNTATLTNKTLTSATLLNPASTAQALTDAATITWDASVGEVASVTLAGNRTLALPTNIKVGTYLIKITQDATGTRTLAYAAGYKWAGGTAPVLSTAANAIDLITFYSDGTSLFGAAQKAFA